MRRHESLSFRRYGAQVSDSTKHYRGAGSLPSMLSIQKTLTPYIFGMQTCRIQLEHWLATGGPCLVTHRGLPTLTRLSTVELMIELCRRWCLIISIGGI